MCAQRFGDACGLGQARDGGGDEKGLRGEKLDLDAIEEDVRDVRKQLELCSVAAKEDGLESGEQPNGPRCASLLLMCIISSAYLYSVPFHFSRSQWL